MPRVIATYRLKQKDAHGNLYVRELSCGHFEGLRLKRGDPWSVPCWQCQQQKKAAQQARPRGWTTPFGGPQGDPDA